MTYIESKTSNNIQTVLRILDDEVRGDVRSALKKITPDYSMTWVYRTNNGTLFPRTGKNIKAELEEVYSINGRAYDVRSIAEGANVVMLEMIESYPDPVTKNVYRTPEVLVLEMRDGKITKGRHYCDPNLSRLYLTEQEVESAYQ